MKLELVAQRLRPRQQLVVRVAGPGHGFELRQVRRQHGATAVGREIGVLGIHQHRHALFATLRNQRRHIAERALSVVRQNANVVTGQFVLQNAGHHGCIVRSVDLFGIKSQQLLVAAQDAKLGDRRPVIRLGQRGLNALRLEQFAQYRRIGIFADDAGHRRHGPEPGQVNRDIRSTTGTRLGLGHTHNRHRRFRRDSRRRPEGVLIEHQIAHDQNSDRGKVRNSQTHG